jgi:hypothetical protein
MLVAMLRHSAQMLQVSQALHDERTQRLAASHAPLVAWNTHTRDATALTLSVREAIAQQLEAQNVEFERDFKAMLELHAGVVAESEASALALLREFAQAGRLLPAEVETFEEQIRQPLEQLLKQPRSAWITVSSEAAVGSRENDLRISLAPADEANAGQIGMAAAGEGDANSFQDSRSGLPADDGAFRGDGAGDFLDRPEQTVSELFESYRSSSGSGTETPAAMPPAGAARESSLYDSNGEINQAAYRALIDGALGRQLTPASSAHEGSSTVDSDVSSAPSARRKLEDSAARSVDDMSVEDCWSARRGSGRSGRRTAHSWVSIADDVVDESHLFGRRRSLTERSVASQSVADSVMSNVGRAAHESLAESVPDDGSITSRAALAVAAFERERLRADLTTLERYESEREELAAAVRALQARSAGGAGAPTQAEVDRLTAACTELTERQAGPLAALSERAELHAEPRALAVWHQLILTDLEVVGALLPRGAGDSDSTLAPRSAAAADQLRQALAAGAELGAEQRAAGLSAHAQTPGRAGVLVAPPRAADAASASRKLGSRRSSDSDGEGQYYSASFAEPPSETEHYSASFCSIDDDAGADKSATRNASLAQGGSGGSGAQLRMDSLIREVEAKRAEARELLASLGRST